MKPRLGPQRRRELALGIPEVVELQVLPPAIHSSNLGSGRARRRCREHEVGMLGRSDQR
jgi:hypothetical protein